MKSLGKIFFTIILVGIPAYIVSNILGNQYLSNFISPVIALSSALLIAVSIKGNDAYSINMKLLGLGALVWAIGDLIWLLMFNFWGIDPSGYDSLTLLYFGTNIAIVVSLVRFFGVLIKRKHRFQLLVETVITTITTVIILWDSLIEKIDFSLLSITEIALYGSILLSCGLMLAIVIIILSFSQISRLPLGVKMVIFGCIGYSVADLMYLYSDLAELYTPNGFIDTIYSISISSFGLTGAWVLFGKRNTRKEMAKSRNTKSSKWRYNYTRILFLVVIPILMVVFGILSFSVLLLLLILSLTYELFSSNVRIAIANEELLHKEQSINENLEILVEKRTAELKELNKKLERSVYTDFLCDMNNRRHFVEKIDELISSGVEALHIYYIDLDHFKIINDTHGHDMGDRVLKIIANRLKALEGSDITVCRVGGDEFGIIHSIDVHMSTPKLCDRVIELTSNVIQIDGYSFILGASIGITKYPIDSVSRESLIKYADTAMYQAKRNHSKDKCVVYNLSYGESVARKNQIELLLRNINFDEEFDLSYQPQFSIDGSAVIGVEALIRWNSKELGNVPPNEFIGIAEEGDSILRIGKWVIDKAFRQISCWNKTYSIDLRIGINISSLQFDSVDFLTYIRDRILHYEIDPRWVDFEITETSAMTSSTRMEEIFAELSDLGITISIDDFGTGYSSLSYIKRFNIDHIKIAKELTDHIVLSSEERLIVKAIILMAQGMNLMTIAEGVETFDQLEVLRELGCDAIQGYYFSRPISSEVFESSYLKVIQKKLPIIS